MLQLERQSTGVFVHTVSGPPAFPHHPKGAYVTDASSSTINSPLRPIFAYQIGLCTALARLTVVVAETLGPRTLNVLNI